MNVIAHPPSTDVRRAHGAERPATRCEFKREAARAEDRRESTTAMSHRFTARIDAFKKALSDALRCAGRRWCHVRLRRMASWCATRQGKAGSVAQGSGRADIVAAESAVRVTVRPHGATAIRLEDKRLALRIALTGTTVSDCDRGGVPASRGLRHRNALKVRIDGIEQCEWGVPSLSNDGLREIAARCRD